MMFQRIHLLLTTTMIFLARYASAEVNGAKNTSLQHDIPQSDLKEVAEPPAGSSIKPPLLRSGGRPNSTAAGTVTVLDGLSWLNRGGETVRVHDTRVGEFGEPNDDSQWEVTFSTKDSANSHSMIWTKKQVEAQFLQDTTNPILIDGKIVGGKILFKPERVDPRRVAGLCIYLPKAGVSFIVPKNLRLYREVFVETVTKWQGAAVH